MLLLCRWQTTCLNEMLMSMRRKPTTLVSSVTNMRPTKVSIGMKKPMVLNALRMTILAMLVFCASMSATTAENMMNTEHVRNGMADNSPFFD